MKKEITALHEQKLEIDTKLGEMCCNAIKEELNTMEDKLAEFPSDDEDFYDLSVTYDGGNHPEYAADPYARVEYVQLTESDNIEVETEYGTMYADGLTAGELYSIYEAICRLKTKSTIK